MVVERTHLQGCQILVVGRADAEVFRCHEADPLVIERVAAQQHGAIPLSTGFGAGMFYQHPADAFALEGGQHGYRSQGQYLVAVAVIAHNHCFHKDN